MGRTDSRPASARRRRHWPAGPNSRPPTAPAGAAGGGTGAGGLARVRARKPPCGVSRLWQGRIHRLRCPGAGPARQAPRAAWPPLHVVHRRKCARPPARPPALRAFVCSLAAAPLLAPPPLPPLSLAALPRRRSSACACSAPSGPCTPQARTGIRAHPHPPPACAAVVCALARTQQPPPRPARLCAPRREAAELHAGA